MWYSYDMDDSVKNLLNNTREAAERAMEVQAELELPETAADARYYQRLGREAARLAPYAEAYRRLKSAADALDRCRTEKQSAEGEFRALYQEEEDRLSAELKEAEANAEALVRLTELGGNEPCVLTVKGSAVNKFGVDVLRLYRHYLDLSGVRYAADETAEGGTLTAEGGLGRLHFEAGLHKRSDGASCTVTVMPAKPEGEVCVSPEDIRVDIFCSSGKGGQNVNKVETAVRITHVPTGTVVTCQDERSQLMNKRRALATLAKRLGEERAKTLNQAYVLERDAQIKDRSNAIRRYDIANNKLCDTRTNVSVPLKEGMRGKIERLILSVAGSHTK